MSQPEEPQERKEPLKEWTVMFYFASDNPLAPSAVQQLKAIKNAGYHPEANVLVQFDPHTVNTPAHIFDVNVVNKIKARGKSDVGFLGNDPLVRNLACDKLWVEDEIRRGIGTVLKKEPKKKNEKNLEYNPPKPTEAMSQEQNPKESLDNFLTFCRQNYPARHYMLFIMGHGLIVGNDLFLLDEHGSNNNQNSSQNSVLLTDLGKILKKFKTRIGKEGELELIGFHACSMSGAEVAYELRGTANYMLASQGPAFVGSWPYRQILVRLFNELQLSDSSSITTKDLINPQSLITKLKTERNSAFGFLRRRLNGSAGTLLKQHDESRRIPSKLITGVVSELNGLVSGSLLTKAEPFHKIASITTRQVIEQHQEKPLANSNLKKLNRQIICDAFPQEIRRFDIRDFLKQVFYYCLYNSFDFQLAGYSFDLCLCDLTKVGQIKKPLDNLSLELIRGLRSKDPLIQELILLAHWEAQSFFGENYTDLYDFCFCLNSRLSGFGVPASKRKATKSASRKVIRPASPQTKRILEKIHAACEDIMEILKRGVRATGGKDDVVIVRSESAGPAFQYSHGLSIFFPWAEPVGSQMWDQHYEQFELIEETSWGEFLKTYFAETQRKPHVEERDPRDKQLTRAVLDEKLLTLFQEASAKVFNDDGQLSKSGANDTVGPGKSGSIDPTGSDCECGSIKNYPAVTSSNKLPASPNFFRRLRLETSFPKDGA